MRAATKRRRLIQYLRAGHTLIELTVVLLLIAILAVVAQSRFTHSLARWQAFSLAHRIAADIESTRQAARASSTSKSITFNTISKTYTLNGIPNPDRKSAVFSVSLASFAPAASFAIVNLGGDSVLTFNGFGFPDSGGTISITVGTFTSTVTIDALTGNTTIT